MTTSLRIFLITFFLFVSFGCAQQAQIKLVQNGNELQAEVQLLTNTSTIFSGYLQDLNMLAGIASTETTVPLLFDMVFSDLHGQSHKFAQSSHYDANNKSYKVQTNFTYPLSSTDEQLLWAQVLHLHTDAQGNSTLSVRLNRAVFERLAALYPAVPEIKPSTTQSSYQQDLSRIIGFTRTDQDLAFRQIGLASLKLTMVAPKTIKVVRGGRITGSKGTQAEFTLNILDFIFKDDAEVSVSW